MPVQYYLRDGLKFGVSVPDGYTPTEDDLDAAYNVARFPKYRTPEQSQQRIGQSIAQESAGLGITPEAARAQGIAPAIQQAQAAEVQRRNDAAVARMTAQNPMAPVMAPSSPSVAENLALANRLGPKGLQAIPDPPSLWQHLGAGLAGLPLNPNSPNLIQAFGDFIAHQPGTTQQYDQDIVANVGRAFSQIPNAFGPVALQRPPVGVPSSIAQQMLQQHQQGLTPTGQLSTPLPETDPTRQLLQGLGETVGGFGTSTNLPLLAGMMGLGALGEAGSLAQSLIGRGFTAQMLGEGVPQMAMAQNPLEFGRGLGETLMGAGGLLHMGSEKSPRQIAERNLVAALMRGDEAGVAKYGAELRPYGFGAKSEAESPTIPGNGGKSPNVRYQPEDLARMQQALQPLEPGRADATAGADTRSDIADADMPDTDSIATERPTGAKQGEPIPGLTPQEQAYVDSAKVREGWLPTNQVNVRPDLFQFRRRTVADFPNWNVEEAAKNPISVWTDTKGEVGEPGQVYAVNGHNRMANAEKFDVPAMRVRHLDAETAAEAKRHGTIENLLDSPRNDALDVARFLRETDLGRGDAAQFLRDRGVNTQNNVMREAVNLSKLPDSVFDIVYRESDARPGLKSMASAVAEHFSPDQVVSAFDEMYSRMQAGQKVTPDVVAERASIARAQSAAASQGGLDFDLGDTQTRAEVLADVKKHFKELAAGGRKIGRKAVQDFFGITTEQAAKRNIADQIGEIIDRTANISSPLATRISEAVKRITEGADRNAETESLIRDLEQTDASGRSKLVGESLDQSTGQRDSAQPGVQQTAPVGSGSRADVADGGQRSADTSASTSDNADASRSTAEPDAGRAEEAGQRGPKQSLTLSKAEANELSNHPFAPDALREMLDKALTEQSGRNITVKVSPRALEYARALAENTEDYTGYSKARLLKKIDAAVRAGEKPSGGKLMSGVDPTGGRLDQVELGDAIKKALGVDAEGIAGVKQVASGLRDNLRNLFASPSADAYAGETSRILRERNAELAANFERAIAGTKKIAAAFDRLPVSARLDFIDKMENGLPQDTPELDAAARVLREALDKTRDAVRSLPGDALGNFIDNYFPHIWKDHVKAGQVFGKRPLEGSKGFLKQRKFPTTAEGIAEGLEPISTNPVELALMKIHEMNRYIMGQKVFAEMKERGLAVYQKGMGAPDVGYAPINDKIARVWRPSSARMVDESGETITRPQTGEETTLHREGRNESFDIEGTFENDRGFIQAGQWVAPEGAARVLNNFLSPGLRGQTWYDVLSYVNNHMNQANLGLSLFHFTGVSLNAMLSKMAVGGKQIARGQVIKGAGNVLRGAVSPLTPLEYFLDGGKLSKEVLSPGSMPPGSDYPLMAEYLQRAGGRVAMSDTYKTNSLDTMLKAFREGRHGKGILNIAFAALDAASRPLMSVYVPRIKLGAFADMVRHEIGAGRLSQEMPIDAQREVLGKLWDSVDNRFGQLVYDNLFWHRALKDSLQLGVRSLGWNLGTEREIGGGVRDLLTTPWRVKKGGEVLTDRMAYTMALAMGGALYGAAYGYLHGHPPQTLEDYYFPKNSSGERVNLPTYVKDMVHYSTDPYRTIKNKVAPIWYTVGQSLENKDFYGDEIRNHNHPLVQRAEEEAGFLLKQMAPFSLTQMQEDAKKGKPLQQRVEDVFGFTPVHH